MTTRERINILSRLCQIGQELSSSVDTDELLAKISRCSSEVCESETASIILLDEDTNELYFKEVMGELGEVIKRIRFPLNEHSIAGWCVVNRKSIFINDVSKDPRHYKKVDEAASFITRSLLAVPIVWGDKIFGCIEAVNKIENKQFDEKDQEYLTILAHQAAVALNNVYLMERLQNFFSYSVEILIMALETLNPNAEGHITRVARFAVSLAREMGYTGSALENVWYASYFHDVGKLARESIYMSAQEAEKLHPVLGAGLLENIKILENAVPLIRYHHERYDGSGYPEGLTGDNIPEAAQLLGIAEDYDEMWSLRSQEGIERTAFNNKFIEYAEGKFKPDIINKFKIILERLSTPRRF